MATILVVHDHPADRELLVTLLGYYGHRLLEATDGAEGPHLARAERPDLIISDIFMPSMDGYAFVRQLRADPTIAKTAIIIYTANYLEREALAMAQACGVSQVLSKPCEPADILRTVAAVLYLTAPAVPPLQPNVSDRDDIPVSTDRLSQEMTELMADKLRLIALIEFRQRLAMERSPQRLLDGFCHAARELIGANLMRKLGLRTQADITRYAIQ